jgi:hypothetical protein
VVIFIPGRVTPWIEPKYELDKRLIELQSGSAHFGEEKLNAHVRVNFTLEQATKAQRGVEVYPTLSLTSALDGGR